MLQALSLTLRRVQTSWPKPASVAQLLILRLKIVGSHRTQRRPPRDIHTVSKSAASTQLSGSSVRSPRRSASSSPSEETWSGSNKQKDAREAPENPEDSQTCAFHANTRGGRRPTVEGAATADTSSNRAISTKRQDSPVKNNQAQDTDVTHWSSPSLLTRSSPACEATDPPGSQDKTVLSRADVSVEKALRNNAVYSEENIK